MTHNTYAMLTNTGKKYLADRVAGVQPFETLYMTVGNYGPFYEWQDHPEIASLVRNGTNYECSYERVECALESIGGGAFTMTATVPVRPTPSDPTSPTATRVREVAVFTAKTGGVMLFYRYAGTTTYTDDGTQLTITLTAEFRSLPDEMGEDPCITADGLEQLVELFINASADLPVYLSYGYNGVEAAEARVQGAIAKNGDYGITVSGTIAGSGDYHTVNQIWLSTSPTAPPFAWAGIDRLDVHEGDSLAVTLSTSIAY